MSELVYVGSRALAGLASEHIEVLDGDPLCLDSTCPEIIMPDEAAESGCTPLAVDKPSSRIQRIHALSHVIRGRAMHNIILCVCNFCAPLS